VPGAENYRRHSARGTRHFFWSSWCRSHLFYQYIEALAASGITAGCTAPPNPQYCPDAPLTRGQMAVFLARAFGLHWVP